MTDGSEDKAASIRIDDLDAISAIAERRREDLRADLAKPIPDFIESTELAEVSYTIEPVMLPFAQMDFQKFAARLKLRYSLTYKRPTIPRPLLALGAMDSEAGDSAFSAVGELLEADMPSETLEFVQGRILIGTDDAVPIKRIRMNLETVHVVVQGSSKVAEVIAKEVVEELWSSTGIPKRWDSIKSMLRMISYGTATKVDFGMPLGEFLAQGFRGFVESQCLAGMNFCARSVARSGRDGFAAPAKTVSTWTVDDIKIYFHVFNQLNGRSEKCQFRFTVQSRDEEGTGFFVAVSQLPFDDHVECLRMLKEDMERSDQG